MDTNNTSPVQLPAIRCETCVHDDVPFIAAPCTSCISEMVPGDPCPRWEPRDARALVESLQAQLAAAKRFKKATESFVEDVEQALGCTDGDDIRGALRERVSSMYKLMVAQEKQNV